MSFKGFYQQFLIEKRSSPKQYVVDILEKYKDDPDVYISFTQDLSGPKLGINPKSRYSTPLGIYAYPLKIMWDTIRNYSQIPFAKEHPNLYVFKPNDPSKVLYNSKYTMDDYKKDIAVREDPKETQNFIHARDVYRHPEDHPEDAINVVRTLIESALNKYEDFSCFHSKGFIYGRIFNQNGNTKYYRITADEKKLRDIINVAYAKSFYKCEKVKMIIMDEEYSDVAQILKNPSDFTFSSYIDMIETYGDYSEHLPWEDVLKEILKVYKNFIITEEEFALQLFPYLKLTDHTVYDILYGQFNKIKTNRGYQKTPAQSFMSYCYEKTRGNPLKWARYMNQKGYVGIVDDTGQGIIHRHEPVQAVFFNLRDLQVLELIKNKGLANWKPVDDELLSELLQFLGSVGVYDKKDRGYAVQDVNVKEFYIRLFRFLLIETLPKIEQNLYVRLNRYDDDDVKPRQDKPRSLGEYANKIETLGNIAYANDEYDLGTCLKSLEQLKYTFDSLKTGENNWSSISNYYSSYIYYFRKADIYPNFESIIEDKIKELIEISKKKPSRVNESFNIDLDHAYDLFQQEYNKSTGQSWSKDKFLNRAHNWQFYGDESGFIAVRPQKSGFYKLVGSAGSNRSKLNGFKEALSKGLPLWGMVSKDIVGLLLKLGFRAPNFIELKMLEKMLSQKVLGDAEIIEYTDDGGVTLRYSDIGVVTKYFVGSPAYWKKLYSLKHLLKN